MARIIKAATTIAHKNSPRNRRNIVIIRRIIKSSVAIPTFTPAIISAYLKASSLLKATTLI
jgi:hypothetical protein